MSLKKRLKFASLISISTFIFLTSWSFSNPIGSSPDEGLHLVGIWCNKADQNVLCSNINEGYLTSNKLSGLDSCYIYDANQPASCILHKPNVYNISPSYVNNLYYKSLSFFTSNNLEKSVLLMRVFNVSIFVFLTFISIMILNSKILNGVLYTSLTLTIPLGMYLISSINTSSWILITSIFFIPFSLNIFEKNTILVKVISFAIISGLIWLAVNSRLDGVLFIIIFSLIILLHLFNKIFQTINTKIKNHHNFFQRLFVIFLSSIFIYLIYQVSSKIVERSGLALYSSTQKVTLWETIFRFTSIVTGALGSWGLGSLEVTMPDVVRFISLTLFIAVIFFSFATKNLIHIFSILILIYFLIFIIISFLYFSQLTVGQWLQPRYILPLILSIGTISFMNFQLNLKVFFRFSFIMSFFAFFFSLHTVLKRYTIGLNNNQFLINNHPEWWWKFTFPAPMNLLLIACISYIIACVACIKLIGNSSSNNSICY